MKHLVILGAGTSGTVMANKLIKKLNKKEWKITIVDEEKTHYYQPGFLFIPFGIYDMKNIVKPIDKFIPKGVHRIQEKIVLIDKDNNTVKLVNGEELSYEILIIATGCKTVPDEIMGLKGYLWNKDIFDFYSPVGTAKLAEKLKTWAGGHLVVHVAEMPIKCPVAPLEFAFLADSFFRNKKMRDKVKITYVTPLSGAFTKEKCTQALSYLLKDKNIEIIPDFAIERVDNENKKLIDYSGSEISFDLLVTVPTNMGSPVIEASGIGDELNFVPTHKHTLQSLVKENIFVIGDATNVPASKAGSVAHFEAEILTENIERYIKGKPLKEDFDGHSNCFIETGNNKALLIDFNYEIEPVEGKFPFPKVGPLSLLKESKMNHLGKLAFKWVYWNMLLPGIEIPFVPAKMSKKGKKLENINN